MPKNSDPEPKLNLLRAGVYSPMNFMREHLIYDEEVSSAVRFWGMFEMPDWTGVEDNEFEYVVQDSWERLDIIAKKSYGKGKEALDWVIAARNGLDLPAVQLYKGKRLKIPHLNWVESTLLSQGAFVRRS